MTERAKQSKASSGVGEGGRPTLSDDERDRRRELTKDFVESIDGHIAHLNEARASQLPPQPPITAADLVKNLLDKGRLVPDRSNPDARNRWLKYRSGRTNMSRGRMRQVAKQAAACYGWFDKRYWDLLIPEMADEHPDDTARRLDSFAKQHLAEQILT